MATFNRLDRPYNVVATDSGSRSYEDGLFAVNAAIYRPGEVLGRLANGDFTRWVPGGSGGAEVIAGVSVAAVSAIEAKARGTVLARSSQVVQDYLQYGDAVTPAQKTTSIASLRALGIIPRPIAPVA